MYSLIFFIILSNNSVEIRKLEAFPTKNACEIAGQAIVSKVNRSSNMVSGGYLCVSTQ